jgi:hypothetical protein
MELEVGLEDVEDFVEDEAAGEPRSAPVEKVEAAHARRAGGPAEEERVEVANEGRPPRRPSRGETRDQAVQHPGVAHADADP